MSAEPIPISDVLVGEREHWKDGPPHELFRELRGKCPVHFTREITEYPTEAGFWSVTTAEDVHAVSRDCQVLRPHADQLDRPVRTSSSR